MIVTLKGIDNEQFGVELMNITAVQPVTDGVETPDGRKKCCSVKTISGEAFGVLGSAKETIAMLNASHVHFEAETNRQAVQVEAEKAGAEIDLKRIDTFQRKVSESNKLQLERQKLGSSMIGQQT